MHAEHDADQDRGAQGERAGRAHPPARGERDADHQRGDHDEPRLVIAVHRVVPGGAADEQHQRPGGPVGEQGALQPAPPHPGKAKHEQRHDDDEAARRGVTHHAPGQPKRLGQGLDHVIRRVQPPEQRGEAEQPVIERHAPANPDDQDEYRQRQGDEHGDLGHGIGPEVARFVQRPHHGFGPDVDAAHGLVFARHVDPHVQFVGAGLQLRRCDEKRMRAHPAHVMSGVRRAHGREQLAVDEQRAAFAQARQVCHPGFHRRLVDVKPDAVPDGARDARPVRRPAVGQRDAAPWQVRRWLHRIAGEDEIRLDKTHACRRGAVRAARQAGGGQAEERRARDSQERGSAT